MKIESPTSNNPIAAHASGLDPAKKTNASLVPKNITTKHEEIMKKITGILFIAWLLRWSYNYSLVELYVRNALNLNLSCKRNLSRLMFFPGIRHCI